MKSTVYGVVSRPKAEQDFTFDPDKDLEPISGGLYYMTLTRKAEPDEVYGLVLNAKDGNILKIIKAKQKKSAEVSVNPLRDPRTLEAANRFMQEKSGSPLSELVLDENIVRWNNAVEVYYTSEDNQSLRYCVLVDDQTKQIVGFSKDVMTLLSYYLGSMSDH